MQQPHDSLPDYDAVVAEYERFAEPATAAFGACALAMLAVRPGERVLDIAAGTGALTLPLLDAGADVTATDLSAPMVAHLAARMGDRGRAQVEDGQALSFADGRFDATVSMFGIMLFPDFTAGVREMVRVVRPGGRAVLGSWTGMTAPMRLLIDAVALALPGRSVPTMPAGVDALGNEAGLIAVLTTAGLTDVRVEQLTLPWTSPPLDRLVAEGEAFFARIPPLPTLAEAERRQLFGAMTTLATKDRDFTSMAVIGLGRKP